MKEQAGTAEQELEGEPRATCRESIPQVEILRVEILGVRVDAVSLDELMAIAGCWAEQDRRRTILYVNAHCLNVAARDCAYREVLNSADLVYADGIGAVLAGRMLNVGISGRAPDQDHRGGLDRCLLQDGGSAADQHLRHCRKAGGG